MYTLSKVHVCSCMSEIFIPTKNIHTILCQEVRKRRYSRTHYKKKEKQTMGC